MPRGVKEVKSGAGASEPVAIDVDNLSSSSSSSSTDSDVAAGRLASLAVSSCRTPEEIDKARSRLYNLSQSFDEAISDGVKNDDMMFYSMLMTSDQYSYLRDDLDQYEFLRTVVHNTNTNPFTRSVAQASLESVTQDILGKHGVLVAADMDFLNGEHRTQYDLTFPRSNEVYWKEYTGRKDISPESQAFIKDCYARRNDLRISLKKLMIDGAIYNEATQLKIFTKYPHVIMDDDARGDVFLTPGEYTPILGNAISRFSETMQLGIGFVIGAYGTYRRIIDILDTEQFSAISSRIANERDDGINDVDVGISTENVERLVGNEEDPEPEEVKVRYVPIATPLEPDFESDLMVSEVVEITDLDIPEPYTGKVGVTMPNT